MWILLAILSAVCLGFYDVSKKQGLRDNSVVGVLLLSVVCSSMLLLPALLMSRMGIIESSSEFYVAQVGLKEHGLIVLKSLIVLSSWLFAYIAIKNLPLTIVAPVNATRPMWTLLGALLIFGEHLNSWQWAGVAVIIVAFFAFSLVGKKEGIRFAKNHYIWCLLLAMFLGAASGLYDKYLMRHIDHNAVQVYYTVYQAILMVPVFLLMQKRKDAIPFRWRWWILGISVFLVMSDFFYLLSLTDSESLIAVVSVTRRCGVIIPFLYGSLVLHDKNAPQKAVCLMFVLLGMVFLLLGSVNTI
ncbi:MAG: DMT family transporter [Paludibacteraceae bacterium]|nr:DMT family transporter [Paludibacteraceae bacterium]